MTLSERERFIFHLCTAMVLSVEAKKKNNKSFDMKKIEEVVKKNRARHLTDEEVKVVKEDMQEEVLVGTNLYEEMIDIIKNHELPWSDEDLR